MENQYEMAIAAAVFRYLMETKTDCEFEGEQGVFVFETGEGKPGKKLRCEIYIHEDGYNIYVRLPFFMTRRDGGRVEELRDYLHRINLGIRDGNFEMGTRGDDIRYKCYVDCSEGEPSLQRIERSISLPRAMMEKYWLGAARILFHDESVEDAVRISEADGGRTPWEDYRWRLGPDDFDAEENFEPTPRPSRPRRPAPTPAAPPAAVPGSEPEEESLMDRLRRITREMDEEDMEAFAEEE